MSQLLIPNYCTISTGCHGHMSQSLHGMAYTTFVTGHKGPMAWCHKTKNRNFPYVFYASKSLENSTEKHKNFGHYGVLRTCFGPCHKLSGAHGLSDDMASRIFLSHVTPPWHPVEMVQYFLDATWSTTILSRSVRTNCALKLKIQSIQLGMEDTRWTYTHEMINNWHVRPRRACPETEQMSHMRISTAFVGSVDIVYQAHV